MSDISITIPEILKELEKARIEGAVTDPPNAYTAHEIRDAMQCSRVAVMKHLHALKRSGAIVPVKVHRESLDGRMFGVPGYQFVNVKRRK
jgi:hypothetical protein